MSTPILTFEGKGFGGIGAHCQNIMRSLARMTHYCSTVCEAWRAAEHRLAVPERIRDSTSAGVDK
jgi:hypothetical protein